MRPRNCLVAGVILALAVLFVPTHPLVAEESRPDNRSLPTSVGFDRHIVGVLGRLGCNAGTCHGAAGGKGGFKLSLFGADPVADHSATLDCVDTDDAEDSLLLRKPTGKVRHGGGRRLAVDTWEYRLLARWIEQGAKRGPTGSVRVLNLSPTEMYFDKPGGEGDLRVTAEFRDGSREDVTAFALFRSSKEDGVEVDSKGHVRGRQPGFVSVAAGYGGAWTSAEVLVPRVAPVGFVYPKLPADNKLDGVVLRRLRKLNLVPSSLCTDAEFLRRVSIDVTGSLPTPQQVRTFLADRRPDKRAREIEKLLVHPRHAALWASKFCDWTSCDSEALEEPFDLRPARSRMWHAWFRKRIQENVPYDRMVRGVLCGTTRDGQELSAWMSAEAARLEAARTNGTDPDYAKRPFLDLYWRRIDATGPVPPERIAELTAAAFLGLRLQCAQCHRHPFDRWTQTDYRSFTNIFARVRFGLSQELRVAIADRLEARRGRTAPPLPRLQEVYREDGKERYLPDPASGKPLLPRPPGGPVLDDTDDPREGLVTWMVSPSNPYFARNFANRVWQHYFDRGLVESADEFSDARPPDFPELLDLLAAEFVRGGYDIRRLERLVLYSQTYQRSSFPNETNREDDTGLAHFRTRRPMAEVVADLLHDAVGVSPDYQPDAPAGVRATEVATSRPVNPLLSRIAHTFGRPSRRQVCDCERRSEPVLAESLLLLSDPALLKLLERGRIAEMLDRGVANDEIIEEIYLAALSRLPNAEERTAIGDYLRVKAERRAGLAGLMWSLLNTREFILVH